MRAVLVFAREGVRYAVETRWCFGVFTAGQFLGIPDLPQPLVGYGMYRGEPLPLFDLAPLFSSEPGSGAFATQVVVLGGEGPRLGLWADVVEEVCTLEEGLFAGGDEQEPLLLGVSARLQVLDARRLPDDPRFLIDQAG